MTLKCRIRRRSWVNTTNTSKIRNVKVAQRKSPPLPIGGDGSSGKCAKLAREACDDGLCTCPRSSPNVDTKLEQLAVDARCVPATVIDTHLADQCSHLGRDVPPSWPTLAALPSPIKRNATAMPGQYGLGTDDHESPSPPRPQPRQPSPEESIVEP